MGMEGLLALLLAVGLLLFWSGVYGGAAYGTYKVVRTVGSRRRAKQALEPDHGAIKAIRGRYYRNAVDELNHLTYREALGRLPHNYGWHPRHQLPRRPLDDGGENLRNARLHFADLSGVEILEAYLAGATFRESVLRKTNFRWSYLGSANFTNADCQGANFADTDCRGAVFSGANLRGANFDNAKLKGAKFDGSDLTNAVLTTPSWEEAMYTYKATLTGARLPNGTKHPPFAPKGLPKVKSRRPRRSQDDDSTPAQAGEGQGDWYEIGESNDSGQGDYS